MMIEKGKDDKTKDSVLKRWRRSGVNCFYKENKGNCQHDAINMTAFHSPKCCLHKGIPYLGLKADASVERFFRV